jgi:hypothetical protein
VGRLVEIAVQNLTLHRKLYMARNITLPATRAQTAFWEFVKQKAPVLHSEAQHPERL